MHRLPASGPYMLQHFGFIRVLLQAPDGEAVKESYKIREGIQCQLRSGIHDKTCPHFIHFYNQIINRVNKF